MKYIFTALFFCYSILACHQPAENKTMIPDTTSAHKDALIKVEWYDKTISPLIDTNATAVIIGRGFDWSEGPVWIASLKKLIFSDVPQNKIYQWKDGDTMSTVYLSPSGYTGTAPRKGETGSNGLTLNREGKLLLCQSGNRQVAIMNAALDSPLAVYTALAKGYNGKRFNSPNDIITDSKNKIYFTDPIYGLPGGERDPERELKFEGVYRIANGKVELLIDSISRPNGLALSPDEQVMYIASSDDSKPAWYAYKLDDNGKILSGGILLDAIPLKSKADIKQGPDGFKLDNEGNIFSAGPDGINIISPQGKLLGLIKVYGRSCSNCVFDESKKILFVTADDVLLKIKLH
ncbi:MAG: SMP-30/gluconolactonase/LRE family protein [Chitinophagaceae bacterium]|nr:SMP-30/gluconolactonase/LRE family protein [Chitinophagaceae bacterium]